MRIASGVVALVCASCGASALELRRKACERADPEACYDTARDAAARADIETTRDELARQQGAFDASTCLAHHPVAACFHAVLVVLREPARGLLADYAVPPDVLAALPAYTGDEAQGPHANARDALVAMCAHPGDPIGRSRACIALGDLVTLERAKQVTGFEHVMDGYAAACTLAAPDPLVRTTYHTDACGVADSPLRGSSIFEGRENLERLAQDAAMRAQAEADAAKREAARIAAMKAQELADAAAAAREANARSQQAIAAAARTSDWKALLEALRTRPAALEPATADALATAATAFRDRAVSDAKSRAKLAGGPGGRFIHAALIAQVSQTDADATAARAAYEALVTAARANLVIDQLPAACAALARTVPGHAVHATAKLSCEITPEHTWTEKQSFEVNGVMTPTDVEHRGWRLSVHGEVRLAGATLPIEIADSVDETSDKLERPFAPVLTGLVDAIWKELIAPIDAATAAAALAAGKAAFARHDTKRAENELAIHAVLAGSSEELDQLLAPDRVTFGQLVPATR
ncbi:MAG TPA: hypothetical protein VFQ65_06905 [Kofleriaceae bacterium]|nr:hypothetical protein [Kofleriaceae bacterium]